MKQAQFAQAIKVKEGSLAAWETDRAQPRNVVAVAKRIEFLTRIPAAWILGVEQQPPAPPHPGEGLPRHPQPLRGKPIGDSNTLLRAAA